MNLYNFNSFKKQESCLDHTHFETLRLLGDDQGVYNITAGLNRPENSLDSIKIKLIQAVACLGIHRLDEATQIASEIISLGKKLFFGLQEAVTIEEQSHIIRHAHLVLETVECLRLEGKPNKGHRIANVNKIGKYLETLSYETADIQEIHFQLNRFMLVSLLSFQNNDGLPESKYTAAILKLCTMRIKGRRQLLDMGRKHRPDLFFSVKKNCNDPGSYEQYETFMSRIVIIRFYNTLAISENSEDNTRKYSARALNEIFNVYQSLSSIEKDALFRNVPNDSDETLRFAYHLLDRSLSGELQNKRHSIMWYALAVETAFSAYYAGWQEIAMELLELLDNMMEGKHKKINTLLGNHKSAIQPSVVVATLGRKNKKAKKKNHLCEKMQEQSTHFNKDPIVSQTASKPPLIEYPSPIPIPPFLTRHMQAIEVATNLKIFIVGSYAESLMKFSLSGQEPLPAPDLHCDVDFVILGATSPEQRALLDTKLRNLHKGIYLNAYKQFEKRLYQLVIEEWHLDFYISKATGSLSLLNETVAMDAALRDFTVSSIYIAPDGTVHDPLNGISDLSNNLLRMQNDPVIRMMEDPSRALRAIHKMIVTKKRPDSSLDRALSTFTVPDEFYNNYLHANHLAVLTRKLFRKSPESSEAILSMLLQYQLGRLYVPDLRWDLPDSVKILAKQFSEEKSDYAPRMTP